MRKCVLAFLFCISFAACRSEANRNQEKNQQQHEPKTAVSPGTVHLTPEQIKTNDIQTTEAKEDEISSAIVAIGRIKPRSGAESQVFPPFAGRILANAGRLPRLGENVRAGDLIAEVEQIFAASERVQFKASSLQLQADIEQTRQELDLRQKELDRARQLYEGGAIPLKEFQAAESTVKQMQAKLDGAQRAKTEYDQAAALQSEQRRTPVRAPTSGTITSLNLIPGEQVDPAKSLMTIVDTSTVWAEVAVHERDLPQIRRVRTADILIPSDISRSYRGKLINVGIAVDAQNRTLPVTFEVSNSDHLLKIEMAVEAHVPTGPRQKTIVIPSSAILSDQGVSSVFVETAPGVFQRQTIRTGQRTGSNVVILEGISAGDKVVSVGAQSLNSEALKSLIPSDEEGDKR